MVVEKVSAGMMEELRVWEVEEGKLRVVGEVNECEWGWYCG